MCPSSPARRALSTDVRLPTANATDRHLGACGKPLVPHSSPECYSRLTTIERKSGILLREQTEDHASMIHGALITESLKTDITLDDLNIVVRKIVRSQPKNTTPEQPKTWTVLYFEAEDTVSEALASALSGVLDQPNWYADFASEAETFVVFSDRIFRYSRGDENGRDEAAAYGVSLGVPESQLDWPV